MSAYEARRLENIRRNQSLVRDLGLENGLATGVNKPAVMAPKEPVVRHRRRRQDSVEDELAIAVNNQGVAPKKPTVKRRKLLTGQPLRSSARIASAPSRPTYNEDAEDQMPPSVRAARGKPTPRSTQKNASVPIPVGPEEPATPKLETIMAGWTSWTPSALPPTRDIEGNYHFESHPTFTPNKSPEAINREGCFGGSYWRPLYSRHLRTTISDDWRELPESWVAGLSVERYLTSESYDPEVNKYGVACGQSIEEWEAAGWIAHDYDVRGWFQWYCRFWLGRRCDDDERQIILKKYVQKGIRSVTDEGDELGDDERGDATQERIIPGPQQKESASAERVIQSAYESANVGANEGESASERVIQGVRE
ncbi:Uu.00g079540.m01.CDS01 [Anthostomella pinea]|uniref:Uu.00g079540.m01.CDS01 n=1 Tax=Anthostomella pinea TaxID=933095 RepID=A0AAI8YJC9_9PEZI|nr:Uu.00g079540.m01.CDS01 [Anthostomella pinea]